MKRRTKVSGDDPNQTINTQNDTYAGKDQSITMDMSQNGGNINYDSTYDETSQKTPKPIY